MLICLSPTIKAFAQFPKDLKKHVNFVDSLIESESLKFIQLANMHACGGSVSGYFLDSALVFIDATYNSEDGYLSQKVYWQDSMNMKIIYHEHFPDYGQYEKDFPEDLEFDLDKMIFTDEIYEITYSNNSPNIEKTVNGKRSIIDPKIESFDRIKTCCVNMMISLSKEF